MWPELRVFQLSEQFRLIKKREIRFTFLPSYETDFIDYFHSEIAGEFNSHLDLCYHYVPPRKGIDDIDVVILTNHGSDMYQNIWELRRRLPEDTLIAVWFWDNHERMHNSYRTALAADIIFASHDYTSSYLLNPASIKGMHIPSCTAQWGCKQAEEFFLCRDCIQRSNKLLLNYVDYDFSWRSNLLKEIRVSDIDAENLTMLPDDRTRYFSKGKAERFKEWLGYKTTIILPLSNDLSTRVFDALLAGLVIIVPDTMPDFDKIFSASDQEKLGVVRINDFSISTIKKAHKNAIDSFDEAGEAGVQTRHKYVLENHMLVHRIGQMLQEIRSVSSGEAEFLFSNYCQVQYGLSLIN